jgi:hypothetical protein
MKALEGQLKAVFGAGLLKKTRHVNLDGAFRKA